jgi:hypothetical protein
VLSRSSWPPLAQLAYGLRQDRDDAIPLHFAPLSDSLLLDEGDEDDEPGNDPLRKSDDVEALDVFTGELCWERMEISNGPRGRPSSPSLPLSPISNPSSPVRKRARTSSWEPPVYIPNFLPPFPSETIDLSSPEPVPLPQQPPQSSLTQSQPPLPLVDRPPSPLAGPLTATSTSDYLTRVPYSQSSLSTTAEWHLPLPPPSPPPQLYTKRLPTPQTHPALISAYHHILTHPPLPNASNANPPRHKVAMALLSQTQAAPRWDSPDTLYSNMVPGAPRVAAIGPTFPLPIITGKPPDLKPPKEEDRDRRLPPALPRPVFSTERLTPLVSQQPSRIPDLARFVLPVSTFVIDNIITKAPYPPEYRIFADDEATSPCRAYARRKETGLRTRGQRSLERQPFSPFRSPPTSTHIRHRERYAYARSQRAAIQWKIRGGRRRPQAGLARREVVRDVGLRGKEL